MTPSMNIKSEEYAAIHDALGDLIQRPVLSDWFRRHWIEGSVSLPWTVMASQEAGGVTGPVRNMIVFALLLVILAFLMLSLLAAYVVLHTKQRLEDIENPLEDDKGHPAAA